MVGRRTLKSVQISIHALRKESDDLRPSYNGCNSFQSTLSVRRATSLDIVSDQRLDISIHALRKESDRRHPGRIRQTPDFNPRSP